MKYRCPYCQGEVFHVDISDVRNVKIRCANPKCGDGWLIFKRLLPND